jgi:hypothetical protein
MKPLVLKRKIPWFGAVPVVLAFTVGAFALDRHSADVSDQKSVQVKLWTNEECLKCHTDQATLTKMQSKRGDRTYCQAAFDALTHAGAPGRADKVTPSATNGSYKK